MKKIIYVLILLLFVASGFVFANYEIKNETSEKSTSTPLYGPKTKDELKQWEATPDGIKFREWKASPEGEKVLEGAAKISGSIQTFTNLEAVVTSLSLPYGSRLGFGMMVRINGNDYILSFGTGEANEFKQLRSLKVNDKIIIRSDSVSYAPKYYYPILSGDYVEKDSVVIYRRPPRKDRC